MQNPEKHIKEIKQRVLDMSSEEKWGFVDESFGMWEDYPDDWLDKLRSEGGFNGNELSV